MLNKKKVSFFIAETYPSFAGGGRNAFLLAQFIAKNGGCTTVNCLNYNYKLQKTESKDGVRINRIPYFNKTLFYKILSIPFLFFGYSKLIVKSDIVLIYGSYMPGYEWIILLSRILGKKVVFRSTLLGDDDMLSLSKKPFWFIRKRILNSISLYFSINNNFKNIWRDSMGSKTPIFNSIQGVDSMIFNSNIRKNNNAKTACPIIISNAILIKRKAYAQVFEELSKLSINFKYIVIGQYKTEKHHRSSAAEQQEMNELYALGSKLLGNKVEFLNTLNDIRPQLVKADVFLHASSQEGTSNAVLEAMAVGLPVLIYNPPRQEKLFLHNKTVKVFNDYSHLSEKLLELIQNREQAKKIGENAAQAISKNYTFDKVLSNLLNALYCRNQKTK